MSVSSVAAQVADAKMMTVLNAVPRLLQGMNPEPPGRDAAEFSFASLATSDLLAPDTRGDAGSSAAPLTQTADALALQTAFQNGDVAAARRAVASLRQSGSGSTDSGSSE
ncbi:MAG: hypothetical protein U1F98_04925 [Verrucomicrobiota bacterium]